MDDCRHSDVDLDTYEDYHVISCNQCSRWWRNHMPVAEAWNWFIKYGRAGNSSELTVNISCPPIARLKKGGKIDTVE